MIASIFFGRGPAINFAFDKICAPFGTSLMKTPL